ncbi:MAG: DUF4147 domain-containing protein [Planctomycetota bacterium]
MSSHHSNRYSNRSGHAIRDDAIEIWNASLKAVDARELVANSIEVTGDRLQICDFTAELSLIKNALVVGAGKAAGAMAAGVADQLGALVTVKGRVNVPDGSEFDCGDIAISGTRPTGINLPTDRVVNSTLEICRLIQHAPSDSLVTFVVSGGGSALLEIPEVDLTATRELITGLSRAGATIEQLNTVRKHLSQVKGGSLGRFYNNHCNSRFPLISLAISDVPDDRTDLIASGPTVADDSTPADALQILDRFKGLIEVPEAVVEFLASTATRSPCSGSSASGLPWTDRVRNYVIGSNSTAVAAAAETAKSLGYRVEIIDQTDAEENTTKAAMRLLDASEASNADRLCVISGGEPVVHVTASGGQGGRNHHLVLAAMCKLAGKQTGPTSAPFCLLSGGTDGEDGNVPFPGALFDHELIDQVVEQGLLRDAKDSLARFDSHTFLSRIAAILPKPEIQTNVRDIRIFLRER